MRRPSSDLLQHVDHLSMNFPIAGEHLRIIDGERFSRKIAQFPSGLSENQTSRRSIPGVKLEFPEAVEPAGGDIAEIERRRSGSADPLRLHAEINKMIEVVDRIGLNVIGKAGDEEAFPQMGYGRSSDRPLIQKGPFVPFSKKELIPNGVEYHSQLNLPFYLHPD